MVVSDRGKFEKCCNEVRSLWMEFLTPGSFMSRFLAIPNKYARYDISLVQCPIYITPSLYSNVVEV